MSSYIAFYISQPLLPVGIYQPRVQTIGRYGLFAFVKRGVSVYVQEWNHEKRSGTGS